MTNIMVRLIKLPEVKSRTGNSKSHIYDLSKKGLFPKPVKLSAHSSAWVESEVDQWIDDRIAERDQEAA